MNVKPGAQHGNTTGRLWLLLMALAVFVAIAWQVMAGGPLARFDMWVQQSLQTLRGPALVTTASWITLLGNYYVVAALTVLAAVYLVLLRAIRNAASLLISMSGAVMSILLIKAIVDRPRPLPVDGVVVTSSSFPSGNSTLAAALFVATVLVVFPAAMKDRWHGYVTAMALAAPLLVAASRVALSVHYVSDTLAGLAVGTAWALLGSCLVKRT